MRYLLRPLATLCTFALSLALTWVLSVKYPPPETPVTTGCWIEYEPLAPKREYKPTAGGKLATTDGHSGSFTAYETSDGMSFSRAIYFYDSPGQAKRKLQEEIKGAQVISREPVIDDKGKRIAEKVIVKYKDVGAGLLWTQGSELIVVDSSSVENIFEYIKDSKR